MWKGFESLSAATLVNRVRSFKCAVFQPDYVCSHEPV